MGSVLLAKMGSSSRYPEEDEGIDVRIAVIGDPDAGKTTLITSLVAAEFQPNVPEVIPEVTIPGSVTVNGVTMHIIDTTDKTADDAIETSVVLVLVVDTSNQQAIDRLKDYWKKKIEKINPEAAVVMAGNKSDLPGTKLLERPEIKELMRDWMQVDSILDCSAKTMDRVEYVFQKAQSAYIYPVLPIYNMRKDKLRRTVSAACARIFAICDRDHDGLLNDKELETLHFTVFGTPISTEEIREIKFVAMEQVVNINLKGFLRLMEAFVSNGNLDVIWMILKRYGYNYSLHLRPSFLVPRKLQPAGPSDYRRWQLSNSGDKWLTSFFQSFDKEKKGYLTPKELELLFSVTPGYPDLWGPNFSFAGTTDHTEEGHVTLQGFRALWAWTTHIDHTVTSRYFAYFGCFPEDNVNMFLPLKPKMKRKTMHALVLGSHGSGKSTLLQVLKNKGVPDPPVLEPLAKEVISAAASFNHSASVAAEVLEDPVLNATVASGASAGCYGLDPSDPFSSLHYSVNTNGFNLIMTEIPEEDAFEKYLQPKLLRKRHVDLLFMLYDVSDPDSYEFLVQLQQKLNEQKCPIPCIYLATKTDLPAVGQNSNVAPPQFCKRMGIKGPFHISLKSVSENAVLDMSKFRKIFKYVSQAKEDPRPFLSYACKPRRAGAIISLLKFGFGFAGFGVAFGMAMALLGHDRVANLINFFPTNIARYMRAFVFQRLGFLFSSSTSGTDIGTSSTLSGQSVNLQQ